MTHPPTSATSLLIRQHYERIGVAQGWDNVRVHRLAHMLRMTIYELGELCATSPSRMDGYLDRNKFPPVIALHFAVFEAWYVSEVMGGKAEPVIPMNVLKRAPGIESVGSPEQGQTPCIEHQEPVLSEEGVIA